MLQVNDFFHLIISWTFFSIVDVLSDTTVYMLKFSADCELMFRYWLPECVVYNVSNSSSHVLDSITAEFLEKIQYCALTEKEAHKFFEKRFVDANAEEIELHINDVITNLHKINLLKVTVI